MELEFHRIELRYPDLRIKDPSREGRLLSSIAQAGQKTPVLVVDGGQGRYVLIDGYRRVETLRKLGRDTVEALVLPLPEAEALILAHRMERGDRRSALEEGWLLRELLTAHRMSRQEMAGKLSRSASWVCRRLGLVDVLPESVQQAVRQGRVPAHAAMKSLLPLARANKGECERLVENLGGERISVRGMEMLYAAWRRGDEVVRDRIVSHPLLYLSSSEEMKRPDPPAVGTEEAPVIKEIGAIGGICRRVRRRLLRQGKDAADAVPPPALLAKAWADTRGAISDLGRVMEERLAGC
jgi:ParB family transcriptional regulator, chromosome partitioning protein